MSTDKAIVTGASKGKFTLEQDLAYLFSCVEQHADKFPVPSHMRRLVAGIRNALAQAEQPIGYITPDALKQLRMGIDCQPIHKDDRHGFTVPVYATPPAALSVEKAPAVETPEHHHESHIAQGVEGHKPDDTAPPPALEKLDFAAETLSNIGQVEAGNDVIAAAVEIADLRAANARLQKERDDLRAAIFGNPDYAVDLPNGNFVEMARMLDSARKGALARAEALQKEIETATGTADMQDKASVTDSDLIKRLVIPMVQERSREPNDAWANAASVLAALSVETAPAVEALEEFKRDYETGSAHDAACSLFRKLLRMEGTR